VNLNLLNHSDVPTLLAQHPKHSDAISHSERVPWINVEIIIAHGIMKGRTGVIRDVLCNQ
jgi:transcription elongation factor